MEPSNPYRAPDAPQAPVMTSGAATASLILGVLSLVAWCVPIIGIPLQITGLVLGLKSRQAANRSSAIAGIWLASIGLVLSLANAALGAWMAISGRM